MTGGINPLRQIFIYIFHFAHLTLKCFKLVTPRKKTILLTYEFNICKYTDLTKNPDH